MTLLFPGLPALTDAGADGHHISGDTVAVESPGFYGSLQLIEALGLKAVEVPSSPATGVSPDALELAMQHWPIKAVLLSPNFATPPGPACLTVTSSGC
ncbi:hypothetical protein [Aliamphritea spongicola]|nr:hypothetical protein [Aliamphritea spongicola]